MATKQKTAILFILIALLPIIVSAQGIELVRSFRYQGFISGVYVSGNYAYLGATDIQGDSSFIILNVSDPYRLSVAGVSHGISRTEKLVVEGNYAYLACGGNGLYIFNIVDPSNPLDGLLSDRPRPT